MSGILFPSRAKADFFKDNKERNREIPNTSYCTYRLNLEFLRSSTFNCVVKRRNCVHHSTLFSLKASHQSTANKKKKSKRQQISPSSHLKWDSWVIGNTPEGKYMVFLTSQLHKIYCLSHTNMHIHGITSTSLSKLFPIQTSLFPYCSFSECS